MLTSSPPSSPIGSPRPQLDSSIPLLTPWLARTTIALAHLAMSNNREKRGLKRSFGSPEPNDDANRNANGEGIPDSGPNSDSAYNLPTPLIRCPSLGSVTEGFKRIKVGHPSANILATIPAPPNIPLQSHTPGITENGNSCNHHSTSQFPNSDGQYLYSVSQPPQAHSAFPLRLHIQSSLPPSLSASSLLTNNHSTHVYLTQHPHHPSHHQPHTEPSTHAATSQLIQPQPQVQDPVLHPLYLMNQHLHNLHISRIERISQIEHSGVELHYLKMNRVLGDLHRTKPDWNGIDVLDEDDEL